MLLLYDSVFLSYVFDMGEAVKCKWQNIYSPVFQESMFIMLLLLAVDVFDFFFPSEPLQKCFPMDLEYKHTEKRRDC